MSIPTVESETTRALAASVVVPTHNRAAMLGECLRSACRQDLDEPYEVVVVDDGSTDDTRSVVEAVRSSCRASVSLRYHLQDKAGIGAARNRGVQLVRGHLVCFIDDDVDLPPSWLGALIDGARRHHDAGVVGGPILLRLEGPEPRHCRRDRLPETQLDRGPQVVWDEPLWGANFAVRRPLFDEIGPFRDMDRGDEEDWEDRLLAAGGHTLYLPDAWLWHRRTRAQLGLRRLMSSSYRQGYAHVPYVLSSGVPLTPERLVVTAVRGVGHALAFGCSYGLLRACRAWGMRRRLVELRRSSGASGAG